MRIAPERLSSAIPRSSRSLRTARYSTIRSLTSSRPAWSASRTSRAFDRIEPLLGALAPRDGEQPVEVRANHRRLAARVPHPLEPPELALGLLTDLVGHLGLRDLLAVLLDDGCLVLAELLADRVELLAEDVLALLLLRARLDVLADSLPHLELGQPIALEPDRQLEALDHVHQLEQLHLLLEGEVGRVARRVGERARLADRANERGDALVGAAELQDLLDDRAVLDLELTRLGGRGLLVGPLLDLDEQTPGNVGLRCAEHAPVEAGKGDCLCAAGQSHALCDVCHGADRRVIRLVLRHEHYPFCVSDVDGEGDVHAREDNEVFEGDEQ